MNDEKKKPGCLQQILGIFIIVGTVGSCFYYFDGQKRTETPEIRRERNCGERGKISASIAAERNVKKNLKAPSSARFPWYDASNVSIYGECDFIIRSYVDAQNSFGAMLRSNYYVRLKYDPDVDRYFLIDIRIGK